MPKGGLIAGAGVNHLADVPEVGGLPGCRQAFSRRVVADVGRLRAAVQTDGVDAPARLILQRADAAADRAVFQFNLVNLIHSECLLCFLILSEV